MDAMYSTCPTCNQRVLNRPKALKRLREVLEALTECFPGSADCEFCLMTGGYYEGCHPSNIIADELDLGASITYSLLCEAAREGWAYYQYETPSGGPRRRLWGIRKGEK